MQLNFPARSATGSLEYLRRFSRAFRALFVLYSRARAQREAAAARRFLPGKSVHMFENARRTAEKVKERVSDLSFFLYNYAVV